MIRLSDWVSVLLLVVGIGGYVMSDMVSPTALIPAAIGLVLSILSRWARNPLHRKTAMHLAMAVALAGIAGTVRGLITFLSGLPGMPQSATGGLNIAVMSKSLTCAILIVYLIAGVKSFIDARRQPRTPGL